jgi:putative tryptophan/tyrosine transport system substrate-binding protein
MKRREFISVLGSATLAWPIAVRAQQPGEVRRIGVLGETPGPQWKAFRQALGELGYADGQSIALEWRWAEGQRGRFPDLAAELVRLRMDVIVAEGSSAIRAAKTATSTIPIVMTIAGDPVGMGLVSSLNRPGGNITGSSSLSPELYSKQIELLKELVPELTRIGVLWTGNPEARLALKKIESAAEALGVHLHLVEAQREAELDSAFSVLTAARPAALLVVADPTFDSLQRQIADLAAKARLPAVYNKSLFAKAGGLLVYGAVYSEFFRRAAYYVDKILKGAKPADLPVEQPTKFELVINLKTAKALGLTVPPALLVRADEVIE